MSHGGGLRVKGDSRGCQWEVLGQHEHLVIPGLGLQVTVCSQEGQGHRCHAFQAKEMNLQKHLPAQGTQDCQARHEDLEHLQDHEHQWDQLHPGKRVGGGAAAVQGQCAHTCE